MTDKVNNLALEPLRAIRDELGHVHGKLDDLTAKVDGHTGILVALGRYIHDIDTRVEQLEDKLGA